MNGWGSMRGDVERGGGELSGWKMSGFVVLEKVSGGWEGVWERIE